MQELNLARVGRSAHDLRPSSWAVEIYRANVMTKMQVGGLSELVRMARVAGAAPAA